jgi:hypothetical protein
MRQRIIGGATVAAITAAFTVAAMSNVRAEPKAKGGALVVPFSTFANMGTTPVTGTLTITRFVADADKLYALGTIAATVADGGGIRTGVTTVAVPVNNISGGSAGRAAIAQAAASCGILHLDLGPLNLNLLGLVVDLAPVTLDITAESGPGNLLGNLLCAVTGLLDPGGLVSQLLGQVTNLLNQILGVL